MRLLKLLQLHGRAPTTAEVRLLTERGLMDPPEAGAIIEHLRRNDFFASPMAPDRRVLLAFLARAAHAHPQLIVDNTCATSPVPAPAFGGSRLSNPA